MSARASLIHGFWGIGFVPLFEPFFDLLLDALDAMLCKLRYAGARRLSGVGNEPAGGWSSRAGRYHEELRGLCEVSHTRGTLALLAIQQLFDVAFIETKKL
jgi:hypothetical protein